MRLRVARAVSAVLAFGLPAVTPAVDWLAQAGLLYNRGDTWGEGIPRSTQPRLDIDLRLNLRGAIASPGVFSYGGSVGYHYLTAKLDGSQTQLTNSLTYDLRAALMQHNTSPVGLSVHANRTDTRFETPTNAQVMGNRVSDNWGGTLRLQAQRKPSLSVGYDHSSYEETFPSLAPHTVALDSLTARLSHNVSAFAIGASYRGDRSDGTWIVDQFDAQQVDVSGSVFLSSNKLFTVTDRYYRRIPTSTSASAFAIDTNAFMARLRLGIVPGEATSVAYMNQHGRTELAGETDDRLSNSLRYHQDFRTSNTLFIRAFADLSMTEQRSSLSDLRSQGATAGPEFWWRTSSSGEKIGPRRREGTLYEFSAGPLGGVLAVEGEPTRYGYGGVLRGRVERTRLTRRYGGSYLVNYGNDLFGRRGWSIEQNGSFSVSGTAGIGQFSAQATLLSRRAWTPVFGDEAARSLSLLADYRWRRYMAFGQASLSSGILPGTDSFVGDGVLVPIGFSTSTASGLAGASAVLITNLFARASIQYAHSLLPGQPDISTIEGTASLAYRYAAFETTIDDRITMSGGRTQNAVFVRISRSFGSRF